MRSNLLAAALIIATTSPAFAPGGHGIFPSGLPVQYNGPGDVVGGAAAWYGLRAYNAAYAASNGKLINISRASDSQTCDILAVSNGGFGNTANCSGTANGQPAATFCNGTTCTIAEWYDQTGNGINLTQATVASQPTLTLNCLGVLPCATFVFQGDASSGSPTTTTIGTVSGVAQRTSNLTSFSSLLGAVNGNTIAGWANASNTAITYQGTTGITQTAADNAWHAFQWIYNSTSSLANVDGVSGTPGSAGSASWNTPINIGLDNGNSLLGQAVEVGLWSVAFNSEQISTMCHNQFNYWGTSTAC
jgi:hypothetical protein